MSATSVTIRAITPTDHNTLAYLTGSMSRHRRPSLSLLAEVDGTPVAAISLTTGAITAKPRGAPPEIIRALRYRRYEILRQGGDVGTAATLLRRFAHVRVDDNAEPERQESRFRRPSRRPRPWRDSGIAGAARLSR